jgi:hypothetical protein
VLLGDFVQKALTLVGITETRVKAVFGDCNCNDRRDRLNLLHAWARQCLGGLARGRMGLADCKRHYDDVFSHYEGPGRG